MLTSVNVDLQLKFKISSKFCICALLGRCYVVFVVCVSVQLSDQVSGLMDIYPTVVEMAGLRLPEGIFFDGESLVQTLFNQTETER